MKNRIYVANLPYTTNETTLEEIFLPFGAIQELQIVFDYKTGKSRGFGFITYVTPAAASCALVMGGQLFEGRKLFVQFAREQYPTEQNLKNVTEKLC